MFEYEEKKGKDEFESSMYSNDLAKVKYANV
jgi:hypothetical protein